MCSILSSNLYLNPSIFELNYDANSFIRVVNQLTNEETVKYELDEDFSIETAVEFGRIYKRNDEWKFEAVGNGLKGGLQDFLTKYQK